LLGISHLITQRRNDAEGFLSLSLSPCTTKELSANTCASCETRTDRPLLFVPLLFLFLVFFVFWRAPRHALLLLLVLSTGETHFICVILIFNVNPLTFPHYRGMKNLHIKTHGPNDSISIWLKRGGGVKRKRNVSRRPERARVFKLKGKEKFP
jgi:hypothetical protein